MSVIVPIKNMKDTSKFSSFCKKTKEPVFVTKNGYGDMVVMNIDLYEKTLKNMEIQKKIIEGLNDVKNGNVIDGKKALKNIRNKYRI